MYFHLFTVEESLEDPNEVLGDTTRWTPLQQARCRRKCPVLHLFGSITVVETIRRSELQKHEPYDDDTRRQRYSTTSSSSYGSTRPSTFEVFPFMTKKKSGGKRWIEPLDGSREQRKRRENTTAFGDAEEEDVVLRNHTFRACIHVHGILPSLYVRCRHPEVSAMQFGLEVEALAQRFAPRFFPYVHEKYTIIGATRQRFRTNGTMRWRRMNRRSLGKPVRRVEEEEEERKAMRTGGWERPWTEDREEFLTTTAASSLLPVGVGRASHYTQHQLFVIHDVSISDRYPFYGFHPRPVPFYHLKCVDPRDVKGMQALLVYLARLAKKTQHSKREKSSHRPPVPSIQNHLHPTKVVRGMDGRKQENEKQRDGMVRRSPPPVAGSPVSTTHESSTAGITNDASRPPPLFHIPSSIADLQVEGDICEVHQSYTMKSLIRFGLRCGDTIALGQPRPHATWTSLCASWSAKKNNSSHALRRPRGATCRTPSLLSPGRAVEAAPLAAPRLGRGTILHSSTGPSARGVEGVPVIQVRFPPLHTEEGEDEEEEEEEGGAPHDRQHFSSSSSFVSRREFFFHLLSQGEEHEEEEKEEEEEETRRRQWPSSSSSPFFWREKGRALLQDPVSQRCIPLFLSPKEIQDDTKNVKLVKHHENDDQAREGDTDKEEDGTSSSPSILCPQCQSRTIAEGAHPLSIGNESSSSLPKHKLSFRCPPPPSSPKTSAAFHTTTTTITSSRKEEPTTIDAQRPPPFSVSSSYSSTSTPVRHSSLSGSMPRASCHPSFCVGVLQPIALPSLCGGHYSGGTEVELDMTAACLEEILRMRNMRVQSNPNPCFPKEGKDHHHHEEEEVEDTPLGMENETSSRRNTKQHTMLHPSSSFPSSSSSFPFSSSTSLEVCSSQEEHWRRAPHLYETQQEIQKWFQTYGVDDGLRVANTIAEEERRHKWTQPHQTRLHDAEEGRKGEVERERVKAMARPGAPHEDPSSSSSSPPPPRTAAPSATSSLVWYRHGDVTTLQCMDPTVRAMFLSCRNTLQEKIQAAAAEEEEEKKKKKKEKEAKEEVWIKGETKNDEEATTAEPRVGGASLPLHVPPLVRPFVFQPTRRPPMTDASTMTTTTTRRDRPAIHRNLLLPLTTTTTKISRTVDGVRVVAVAPEDVPLRASSDPTLTRGNEEGVNTMERAVNVPLKESTEGWTSDAPLPSSSSSSSFSSRATYELLDALRAPLEVRLPSPSRPAPPPPSFPLEVHPTFSSSGPGPRSLGEMNDVCRGRTFTTSDVPKEEVWITSVGHQRERPTETTSINNATRDHEQEAMTSLPVPPHPSILPTQSAPRREGSNEALESDSMPQPFAKKRRRNENDPSQDVMEGRLSILPVLPSSFPERSHTTSFSSLASTTSFSGLSFPFLSTPPQPHFQLRNESPDGQDDEEQDDENENNKKVELRLVHVEDHLYDATDASPLSSLRLPHEQQRTEEEEEAHLSHHTPPPSLPEEEEASSFTMTSTSRSSLGPFASDHLSLPHTPSSWRGEEQTNIDGESTEESHERTEKQETLAHPLASFGVPPFSSERTSSLASLGEDNTPQTNTMLPIEEEEGEEVVVEEVLTPKIMKFPHQTNPRMEIDLHARSNHHSMEAPSMFFTTTTTTETSEGSLILSSPVYGGGASTPGGMENGNSREILSQEHRSSARLSWTSTTNSSVVEEEVAIVMPAHKVPQPPPPPPLPCFSSSDVALVSCTSSFYRSWWKRAKKKRRTIIFPSLHRLLHVPSLTPWWRAYLPLEEEKLHEAHHETERREGIVVEENRGDGEKASSQGVDQRWSTLSTSSTRIPSVVLEKEVLAIVVDPERDEPRPSTPKQTKVDEVETVGGNTKFPADPVFKTRQPTSISPPLVTSSSPRAPSCASSPFWDDSTFAFLRRKPFQLSYYLHPMVPGPFVSSFSSTSMRKGSSKRALYRLSWCPPPVPVLSPPPPPPHHHQNEVSHKKNPIAPHPLERHHSSSRKRNVFSSTAPPPLPPSPPLRVVYVHALFYEVETSLNVEDQLLKEVEKRGGTFTGPSLSSSSWCTSSKRATTSAPPGEAWRSSTTYRRFQPNEVLCVILGEATCTPEGTSPLRYHYILQQETQCTTTTKKKMKIKEVLDDEVETPRGSFSRKNIANLSMGEEETEEVPTNKESLFPFHVAPPLLMAYSTNTTTAKIRTGYPPPGPRELVHLTRETAATLATTSTTSSCGEDTSSTSSSSLVLPPILLSFPSEVLLLEYTMSLLQVLHPDVLLSWDQERAGLQRLGHRYDVVVIGEARRVLHRWLSPRYGSKLCSEAVRLFHQDQRRRRQHHKRSGGRRNEKEEREGCSPRVSFRSFGSSCSSSSGIEVMKKKKRTSTLLLPTSHTTERPPAAPLNESEDTDVEDASDASARPSSFSCSSSPSTSTTATSSSSKVPLSFWKWCHWKDQVVAAQTKQLLPCRRALSRLPPEGMRGPFAASVLEMKSNRNVVAAIEDAYPVSRLVWKVHQQVQQWQAAVRKARWEARRRTRDGGGPRESVTEAQSTRASLEFSRQTDLTMPCSSPPNCFSCSSASSTSSPALRRTGTLERRKKIERNSTPTTTRASITFMEETDLVNGEESIATKNNTSSNTPATLPRTASTVVAPFSWEEGEEEEETPSEVEEEDSTDEDDDDEEEEENEMGKSSHRPWKKWFPPSRSATAGVVPRWRRWATDLSSPPTRMTSGATTTTTTTSPLLSSATPSLGTSSPSSFDPIEKFSRPLRLKGRVVRSIARDFRKQVELPLPSYTLSMVYQTMMSNMVEKERAARQRRAPRVASVSLHSSSTPLSDIFRFAPASMVEIKREQGAWVTLPFFSPSAMSRMFCGLGVRLVDRASRKDIDEEVLRTRGERSDHHDPHRHVEATPKSLVELYGDPGFYAAAVQQLLREVHAMHQIVLVSHYLTRALTFSSMLGISMDQFLSRGSQFKVESTLFRLLRARPPSFYRSVTPLSSALSSSSFSPSSSVSEKKWSCCSPTPSHVHAQPRIQCIALIRAPKAGYYGGRDPILVFDFRSLYPSIVIAFNLCYSTCVGLVPQRNTRFPLSSLGLTKEEGGIGGSSSNRWRRRDWTEDRNTTRVPRAPGDDEDEEDDEVEWTRTHHRTEEDHRLGVLPCYDGISSHELWALLHGQKCTSSPRASSSFSRSGFSASSSFVKEEKNEAGPKREGDAHDTSTPVSSGVVDSITEDPLRESHILFAPNGAMFVKKSIREGMLPRMLREVLDTRFQVQAARKHVKPPPKREEEEEKAAAREDALDIQQLVWDQQQQALKMLANTTYGYTAASYTGRMPCVDLAEAIGSFGRRILQRAIAYLEDLTTSLWGEGVAAVVYGDTDSIFLRIHLEDSTESSTDGAPPPQNSSRCPRPRELREVFEVGTRLAQWITAIFPSPITLAFEKVLCPCLLLVKKRYCGYVWTSPPSTVSTSSAVVLPVPQLLSKGIETVRRDGCRITSIVLERLLHTLMLSSYPTLFFPSSSVFSSPSLLQVGDHLKTVYGEFVGSLTQSEMHLFPLFICRRGVKLMKYFSSAIQGGGGGLASLLHASPPRTLPLAAHVAYLQWKAAQQPQPHQWWQPPPQEMELAWNGTHVEEDRGEPWEESEKEKERKHTGSPSSMWRSSFSSFLEGGHEARERRRQHEKRIPLSIFPYRFPFHHPPYYGERHSFVVVNTPGGAAALAPMGVPPPPLPPLTSVSSVGTKDTPLTQRVRAPEENRIFIELDFSSATLSLVVDSETEEETEYPIPPKRKPEKMNRERTPPFRLFPPSRSKTSSHPSLLSYLRLSDRLDLSYYFSRHLNAALDRVFYLVGVQFQRVLRQVQSEGFSRVVIGRNAVGQGEEERRNKMWSKIERGGVSTRSPSHSSSFSSSFTSNVSRREREEAPPLSKWAWRMQWHRVYTTSSSSTHVPTREHEEEKNKATKDNEEDDDEVQGRHATQPMYIMGDATQRAMAFPLESRRDTLPYTEEGEDKKEDQVEKKKEEEKAPKSSCHPVVWLSSSSLLSSSIPSSGVASPLSSVQNLSPHSKSPTILLPTPHPLPPLHSALSFSSMINEGKEKTTLPSAPSPPPPLPLPRSLHEAAALLLQEERAKQARREPSPPVPQEKEQISFRGRRRGREDDVPQKEKEGSERWWKRKRGEEDSRNGVTGVPSSTWPITSSMSPGLRTTTASSFSVLPCSSGPLPERHPSPMRETTEAASPSLLYQTSLDAFARLRDEICICCQRHFVPSPPPPSNSSSSLTSRHPTSSSIHRPTSSRSPSPSFTSVLSAAASQRPEAVEWICLACWEAITPAGVYLLVQQAVRETSHALQFLLHQCHVCLGGGREGGMEDWRSGLRGLIGGERWGQAILRQQRCKERWNMISTRRKRTTCGRDEKGTWPPEPFWWKRTHSTHPEEEESTDSERAMERETSSDEEDDGDVRHPPPHAEDEEAEVVIIEANTKAVTATTPRALSPPVVVVPSLEPPWWIWNTTTTSYRGCSCFSCSKNGPSNATPSPLRVSRSPHQRYPPPSVSPGSSASPVSRVSCASSFGSSGRRSWIQDLEEVDMWIRETGSHITKMYKDKHHNTKRNNALKEEERHRLRTITTTETEEETIEEPTESFRRDSSFPFTSCLSSYSLSFFYPLPRGNLVSASRSSTTASPYDVVRSPSSLPTPLPLPPPPPPSLANTPMIFHRIPYLPLSVSSALPRKGKGSTSFSNSSSSVLHESTSTSCMSFSKGSSRTERNPNTVVHDAEEEVNTKEEESEEVQVYRAWTRGHTRWEEDTSPSATHNTFMGKDVEQSHTYRISSLATHGCANGDCMNAYLKRFLTAKKEEWDLVQKYVERRLEDFESHEKLEREARVRGEIDR